MHTEIRGISSLPKPRTAAILVTYNRCDYLKHAINSLESQIKQADSLYIVNNASTDGTAEYLASSGYNSDPRFKIINSTHNEGGAGGFHRGMRQAIEDGYDWLWLLDDDCVAHPAALSELMKIATGPISNIGFVCSHVVWKDDSPHEMNLPGIRLHSSGQPFNKILEHNGLLVRSCSFVSALISRDAVLKFGLPFKEMFIWGDDIEYTERITNGEMLGIYAFKSVVTHLTDKNESDDLLRSPPEKFRKHYYGIRNNLFRKRISKGWRSYLLDLAESIFIYNAKIASKRSNSRLSAISTNTRASLASLFFRPSVEYPDQARRPNRKENSSSC
ncbi:glycosyltransferase family 2 protein [Burkholderia aenigmatica]|uniref:glycosyltransferase family 2 protein n=1 Tax=Burkholderia aenigmatica TaxID=2015348 RepID=UPI00264F180B|nr:glycosyltransferase family 2 protein [Burkholderia aenigmatica]MDN7880448.1 glycosyltransferase family 2 protein [Burkholderia aenigmatica]